MCRGRIEGESRVPDFLQDFGGFRVVAVIPRHKPNWPAPGAYETEAPKKFKELGAVTNPLPVLLPGGKAISAATVRLGLGWMEIPFVATQVAYEHPQYSRGPKRLAVHLHLMTSLMQDFGCRETSISLLLMFKDSCTSTGVWLMCNNSSLSCLDFGCQEAV